MQIDIQARSFELSSALLQHAEQRLRCSLAHARDHIHKVTLRLSDVNGPRGGADKRCLVQVRLKRLPLVVVEDTQPDLYAAIDRAMERAARSVGRRLARQRERPLAALPGLLQPAGSPNLQTAIP